MSVNPNPPSDNAAAIAVMSHQIGEVKHAIEATSRDAAAKLDNHGQRIGALEEAQIRQDEREKTEERLRRILAEQETNRAQEQQSKVTFRFSRRQVWLAGIMTAAMVASVVVAIAVALGQ